MNSETKEAIEDVLNAFEDGPDHCTGLKNDKLVWKVSFRTFMDRLRAVKERLE